MCKILKISQTFLCVFLFIFTLSVSGQEGFYFKNTKHNKEKISFQLINNLIVIPLKVNGVKLSFILDTGSDKTILFKISETDSIGLKNPKQVKLRGLGIGEPVDALISQNNKIEIDKIKSNNQTVFVILKDFFGLSSKMGTTIHGIMGYSFFKDFIVNINYKKRVIKLYDREAFTRKKCRKCEEIPLRFYRRKPYLRSKIQLDTIGNTLTDLKLLIDTGGSDAIWLFEGTHKDIVTPKNHFDDILGEGLSGTILGKRSRVERFKLGGFEIKKPTVSFLDSTTTHIARNFKLRNGSIGGDLLKRFEIWLDYKGKSITLKKSGSFKTSFNYNMSGIDIVYDGNRLVKERIKQIGKTNYGQETNDKNSIFLETRYSFKFKPSLKINTIVPNSPADKAGLKVNDVLLSLNNKPIYEYKLEEIIYKLREKENKKIKLKVLREGKELNFKFLLEKKI
jgi:hypothetical protein